MRATGASESPPVRARRRSRVVTEPPRGFRYVAEFINVAEEAMLLAHIARLAFTPFHFRGIDAKREVVHFGARYGFADGVLAPAPALPPFLAALAARIGAEFHFADTHAEVAALVTRYPPGAAIGWHRDAPPFGATVIGISLSTACEMRLRLETETGYDVYRQVLAPRSLYIISGHARFRWQHAIPAVKAERYSITFRTISGRG